DLGWMERMRRSHAVIVTRLGRRGFQETFGIDAPEPNASPVSAERDEALLALEAPVDASITVEVFIAASDHFGCTIAAVYIGPLAARGEWLLTGRGAPHRRTWWR